jgi:hypothetical protein
MGMSVVQKVIKLLCERGCTLDKAGEACVCGMNFDMTVLRYGDKYVNVYSQSGEGEEWMCFLEYSNSYEPNAGRGFEWKFEFNDKVEEIINEYVKFLKAIRIENKISEINKDFE